MPDSMTPEQRETIHLYARSVAANRDLAVDTGALKPLSALPDSDFEYGSDAYVDGMIVALRDALDRIVELERASGIDLSDVGVDLMAVRGTTDPICFMCQTQHIRGGELVLLCAPCALKP